jgi:hypothetical protein
MNMMKKTVIASGIALGLGAMGAHAVAVNDIIYGVNASSSTIAANFTMLSPDGSWFGGANDLDMTWNGNGFNASSDYTGPGSVDNVTIQQSYTPFFGYLWTAHDIQVFVPGSYSFDTTLGGGVPETGILNVTVGAGQLGMHMLWDWNGGLNTDVFVVLAQNSVFGTGVLNDSSTCVNPVTSGGQINCLDISHLVTGSTPVANQIWQLATVDGNGDGVMGIPIAAGGPFADANFAFNVNFESVFLCDVESVYDPSSRSCIPPGSPPSSTPVPTTAWLLGSGLAGLMGFARKRRPAR